MVFALKKKKKVIIGYRNKNQRREIEDLTILKKLEKKEKNKNKATRIIKKHQQQPHKVYIWCLL